MRVQDKVCIVTGSGSGIGKAIALGLAKEGAKLVLVARREEMLKKTQADAGLSDDRCIIIPTDLTNFESVKSMVDKVIEKFGRIDVLVNNAGALIRKTLFEQTHEDWDQIMKTDLYSVLYCVEAVAPHMIEQKYGKIINMGSVGGIRGYMYPSYAAAKGAVTALTKSFMVELSPHNITVNTLCPGSIKTDITLPGMEDRYNALIPLGRMGRPDEIAAAAVFLASDECGFMNGATLVMDGGSTEIFRFI